MPPSGQLTVAQAIALAIQYHQAGNFRDAEQLYRQIIQADPNNADAHNLLGVAAYQLGNFAVAESCIRQALRLNPAAGMFHYNLALVHDANSRFVDALESYETSLRLDPTLAQAHRAAAIILRAIGRLPEAVAHCEQSIRLQPDYADAYNDLGCALFMQKKFGEAIKQYQTAIRFKPHFPQAFNNMGIAYEKDGDIDAAERTYLQAISLQPDYATAHNNLGSFLLGIGKPGEALTCLQLALRADPGLVTAQSNYLFCLNHLTSLDPDTVCAEHRRWGESLAAFRSSLPHGNNPDPERRLRVGYVSPDFRRHALLRYIEPVLAQHDPRQVEVFCYAEVQLPDEATARLQKFASGWRSTCVMSDAQIAGQVRSDQIDILVDLAGHTANNRLRAFAYNPAPIQISWLGYLNTTGLSAMDYRLTDAILDPPGQPIRDTEQLLRLPSGMCCFAPPPEAVATSPLSALKRGHVTFGSLHNLLKVNPAVIALWSEVLKAVPTARLLVYRDTLSPPLQARLKQQFAQYGIGAERLDLRQGTTDPSYLNVYSEIDICLDAFPWTGGVTTCESLWMGVPVVTLSGPRPANRNAAAILTRAGLTDYVAETPAEYVSLAADLTANMEKLAQIRESLRDRMTSTICDAKRFTRELEETYRDIWRRWCASTSRVS